MMSEKSKQKKGLLRIWYAFLYSILGLKHALAKETAFRQEFCIYIILLFVLFFLKISFVLKVILIICNTGVLIVELLNSAIEAIVDKASPEYHELAKQAKDMGSAAVFLSIALTIILWGYIIIVNF